MAVNRRSFLARTASLGLFYGLGYSIVRAQGFDRPADPTDNIEYIDEDRARWFEALTRTDVVDDKANGTVVEAAPQSCCNAGDGYPIIIDEDAYPPHSGKEENGTAHVIDPSAKIIMVPNGKEADGSTHYTPKYRPAITGNLTFHFSGNKITREIEGNPTKTAWLFAKVGYPSEGMDAGQIKIVYCIVPLPPSA